jgi:hypothetical protein
MTAFIYFLKKLTDRYRIWKNSFAKYPIRGILFLRLHGTSQGGSFAQAILLESKLRHWPPGMSKSPLMPPFFLRPSTVEGP